MGCTNGTASPADGSESPGSLLTLRVAEKELLVLVLIASKRMAHSSAFSLLVTCQSQVPHIVWALGIAHTAAKGIESISTLRIPHESPPLTVLALCERSYSSSITLGLVAECKIVWITFGTVLVTERTHASETFLAFRIAKA